MVEKDAETLPQVMSGVMIAVLVIFFILLFHFKRISLALVNLSSMSLCIFGAAVGLCITGYDVSLTCVLGVVSLMGILVRNGIIMLDYAEELRREKGLSVRDAAFQAGERRMRPIFLTSAAASVGVLPMMLENNTLWALSSSSARSSQWCSSPPFCLYSTGSCSTSTASTAYAERQAPSLSITYSMSVKPFSLRVG